MEVTCFVCDNRTEKWRQNLNKTKTTHSGLPIKVLIQKLSNDIVSQRDLNDESNCICLFCLSQISAYDWMSTKAKEHERNLRSLLLKSETNFAKKLANTNIRRDGENESVVLLDICDSDDDGNGEERQYKEEGAKSDETVDESVDFEHKPKICNDKKKRKINQNISVANTSANPDGIAYFVQISKRKLPKAESSMDSSGIDDSMGAEKQKYNNDAAESIDPEPSKCGRAVIKNQSKRVKSTKKFPSECGTCGEKLPRKKCGVI